jgi:hypothetical protein
MIYVNSGANTFDADKFNQSNRTLLRVLELQRWFLSRPAEEEWQDVRQLHITTKVAERVLPGLLQQNKNLWVQVLPVSLFREDPESEPVPVIVRQDRIPVEPIDIGDPDSFIIEKISAALTTFYEDLCKRYKVVTIYHIIGNRLFAPLEKADKHSLVLMTRTGRLGLKDAQDIL